MALGNDKRIIVTGGAGFIGSALIWALNRRGIDNITIVDRLGTDERWKNLMPLSYADYVDADDFLSELKDTGNKFGPVGYIFHMGACSSTTETDAGFLMKNNFLYTRSLAQWAVVNRVRFVYASSAATYGDGSKGMSDEMLNVGDLRPLNMYGYSKQLFDVFAKSRGMSKGLLGLKFFNIYGPNENHKGDMRSVVSKAYDQIVETGRVKLFRSHHPDYRDGEQKRDFLYIKDAVEMVMHLVDRPLSGGLYNIGSGRAASWLELVSGVFHAMGREPKVEFIDMPQNLRATYQYHTEANIEKFLNTNYPREITPLAEAVHDYVVNYLAPGFRLGDGASEHREMAENHSTNLKL